MSSRDKHMLGKKMKEDFDKHKLENEPMSD